MRIFMSNFFIILLCAIFFIGCNKPEETSTKTELEGTWKTSCQALTSASYDATLVFSGSTISASVKLYDGTTCTGTLTSETNSSISFVLGAAATTPTDAKKIDLTVNTQTTTPRSSTTAANYNSVIYCGYSDWTLDQAKNLLGRTCGTYTYPNSGTVSYSIYKLSGTSLQLGEDSGSYDASSEALRHQTLQSLTYTKQ